MTPITEAAAVVQPEVVIGNGTLAAASDNKTHLLPTLLVVAILGVLYAPVLRDLVRQWWDDPNYGHGFLVPVIAGWILWRERSRLGRITPQPASRGLLVMCGAIALLIAGSLGAEVFTSRMSLIILVAGITFFLAGKEMLRAVAFPLCFLSLMIPLPAIIHYQITFPLQLTASRVAASCLEITNVPVLREGNLLYLPNYTLEVVEACSGIRSLVSLLTLGLAYVYFVEKKRWIQAALLLLILPIAVLSNSLRIVGAGLLTYSFGPEAAEGFFHFFSGWVIFMSAALLILAAHWSLRRFAGVAR